MSRALLSRFSLARLAAVARPPPQQQQPVRTNLLHRFSTFRRSETVTKYVRPFGVVVAVAAGDAAACAILYTFLLSSRMTPSPHYSTSTDQPVVPLTPAPAGLSLSAPEAKAAAVMPKDKIVLYQVGIP